MIPFTFVPRGYPHFDAPVSKVAAEALATSPEAVSRHAFYPFIEHHIETRKIAKDTDGRVYLKPPKVRPIAYAAHLDSHIFSHYSNLLMEVYTHKLQELGLNNVVTAFRSLDRQRNIHFANEAFEHIRKTGPCQAIAMDITDFFGTIVHKTLKTAWSQLLWEERLPLDHFAVFKAVTQYTTVNRENLTSASGSIWKQAVDSIFDAFVPLKNSERKCVVAGCAG